MNPAFIMEGIIPIIDNIKKRIGIQGKHEREYSINSRKFSNPTDMQEWPNDDDGGGEESSSSSTDSHPPFLYVIHTVDTPHPEDQRVAAWGHKEEEDGNANSELIGQ
jgi:hypothetical protein